jgi:hypothetical protein
LPETSTVKTDILTAASLQRKLLPRRDRLSRGFREDRV